jgi:molybdenum cofactor cytidylyltransferase
MPDHDNERFAVGAIILAAGASRRMGKPKLLLPWGETTVLGRLLQQCKSQQTRQIAVVCVANAQPLTEELNRLGFPQADRIFNPAPDRGMFSSIQSAADWAGWNAELTHFLITLGDQPHLRRDTLERLLDFGTRNPQKICQPLRNGQRKHPVLLPKRMFAELKTSSVGDLKMFLVERASDLSGFECGDAGLDLDMDTPEDYERVTRMYFGRDIGKTSSTSS